MTAIPKTSYRGLHHPVRSLSEVLVDIARAGAGVPEPGSLGAAHLFYDGPIPDLDRAVVRAGGPRAYQMATAQANMNCYRTEALRSVRIAKAARKDGNEERFTLYVAEARRFKAAFSRWNTFWWKLHRSPNEESVS